MNPQISIVLSYIENHLDDDHTNNSLAKIAGYSPFHFSRIFKTCVGESAISYISRLRLEKASLAVMLTHEKSMIEIALDAGFQTPNGFNKAFKKIFQRSPTEYREARLSMLQTHKEKLMQTPKIIEQETKYIVFAREIGEYEVSSKKAWMRLSKNLNHLIATVNEDDTIVLDPNQADLIGICHDDPTTTAEQNIRYDAAIAWDKEKIDFLQKHGQESKTIEGGKFAVVLHKGSHEKLIESWMALYAWCQEQGYVFRDAPPFEKYLNNIQEVDEKELLTEIYIPIE